MKINKQKIKINSIELALLLCVVGTLSGCATVKSGSSYAKALTVEPAPDAGFIEQPDQQVKRADLPFQKVWIKPGFDMRDYKELIVAPVNTQYMFEMDWLHKASSANWLGGVKKDIDELAKYFYDQAIKDFEADPNHRFQVINSPVQHKKPALRLELALIEIDPSTPVLHAAGWAVMGGGTAAGVVNQRRAAFEGRLRDLQTGEVVATFADRDMQDVGPIDMTRMTWYGPAKVIMKQWTKQFVQIANRNPNEAVTDPTAFTLKPF
ncbi:DUF3313 family protein [Methylobacter sp. S3L5C]|uniref:DUF3313 family protein n=1 Tax=Methylobacter sp. S3L5C TaxID=2839024 RepID=UPI001FADBD9E|nr:DUF3313 family protein [Methylobacter sp. S3L5C]UOA09470.1 DUF3313 domain-containing protein [Methylobacter sp. S3L5C]